MNYQTVAKQKRLFFKKLRKSGRASGLTINNQKEFFNNEFINWKAANNQTDDVILMGVDMSFYIDF